MRNWMTQRKILAITFLFLVLGVFIGWGRVHRVGADIDSTYEKLKVLADVLAIVERNYVEPVNAGSLINGAINGMLETLDPHSSFMNPEVFKEMQTETRGSFGGVGFEITIRDKVLTVVAPIEDTPASRAGIQPGDQILRIDGKSTKDLNLMEAVKLMRGPQGTQVTITVMRSGFTEPQDFTMTRATIPIRSVRSKTLEEGYGYIKINQFIEKTHTDMKAALSQLESKDAKLKGLILDLRNDPGGLLEQAVKVADEFLDSGLIVYTEGRVEGQKMKFYAQKKAKEHDYPLIVLVNAGSASASEIVAGRAPGSREGGDFGNADLRERVRTNHHPPGGWIGDPPDHGSVLYPQRSFHPGAGDCPRHRCPRSHARSSPRGPGSLYSGERFGTPPPRRRRENPTGENSGKIPGQNEEKGRDRRCRGPGRPAPGKGFRTFENLEDSE